MQAVEQAVNVTSCQVTIGQRVIKQIPVSRLSGQKAKLAECAEARSQCAVDARYFVCQRGSMVWNECDYRMLGLYIYTYEHI